MKPEDFTKLKNKYGYPCCTDWDVLYFKTTDEHEIYIYMHNATIKDGKLSLNNCGWEFPFEDIVDMRLESGQHWTSRD